jgi:diguanylate cyclase (GGDEF)-like protein
MLRLHKWKLLTLAFMAQLTLIISLSLADTKTQAEIHWLDVLSEGGFAVLALVWLLLVLQSRPQGRVTQWLGIGLGLIVLAQFQDLLDEFIAFPDAVIWDHWIESGCMLLGMALLTMGIFLWQQEQVAINNQLRKRERFFREHRSLDTITLLSRADYLRQQLNRELENHRQQQAPLALMLIDVDQFDQFNRRHGHGEGDRFLLALSELLLLNLRNTDLLCRYAGDRFAVILPFTTSIHAANLCTELTNAVNHFAFKLSSGETVFNRVSIGIASAEHETVEMLLERAGRALLHAKQRNQSLNVAA